MVVVVVVVWLFFVVDVFATVIAVTVVSVFGLLVYSKLLPWLNILMLFVCLRVMLSYKYQEIDAFKPRRLKVLLECLQPQMV